MRTERSGPSSRGGFLRPEGERPPVDAEKLREGGAALRGDRDGAAVSVSPEGRAAFAELLGIDGRTLTFGPQEAAAA